MTANSDDRQPGHPPAGGVPQPGPEEWLASDEDLGEELTAEQVAELTRQDWEAWGADPDDPEYADDPGTGPPAEWLALPAAELMQLLADDGPAPAPEVPEAIDAGFTHRSGGKGGAGFAAGGPLDALLPGADLAWHIARARRDLKTLTDDEVVGVMVAGRKLESWAAEVTLSAVSEVDARRTARDGEEGQHVSEEIGAALALTPRSADILAGLAAELSRLPMTRALLANGIIDQPRAKVIIRSLAPLADEDAAAVEDVIARRAGELNTGRLAAACDAAVKAADPAAARRRKETALQRARVEAWSEPGGTAALAGRDLPPAEVIAADKRLDADAQWLRDHGVEGTWDQLRAKAFGCHLTGQPLASLLPARSPSDTTAPGETTTGSDSGTAPASKQAGTVNLTMPWSAFQGLTDHPGEVAGFGAADADTCRDLAGQMAAAGPATRWCITITDQHGRAVGHGCARAGPGPPGTGDPRTWLTKVTVLPIETGGCAHRRESAGYQPSPTLRHIVKTRSRRCGYPGCGRPAVRCDDDHTIAYHLGGRTCECNLYPLCRRHHRCKQSPGWHLDQPRPGILIWRAPSGRRYRSLAEPYPV
jgi:hypothetical protein